MAGFCAHLHSHSVDNNHAGCDTEDVEAHTHSSDVGRNRREVIGEHCRVCTHDRMELR